MRRAPVVAVCVVAAFLGSAGGSPAHGETTVADRTVTVAPVVGVVGSKSSPDPSALRDAEQVVARSARTVRLSGTASQQAAQLRSLRAKAREASVDSFRSATARVTGSCGWSEITLEDTSAYKGAYVKGRFSINRPGYAYRTNIKVWDTAALDLSEWNWPETGNLNGGTSWWDDFTFTVDEAFEFYGAQLSRGDVYTSKGWCTTGRPKVDGVLIG